MLSFRIVDCADSSVFSVSLWLARMIRVNSERFHA